MTANSGTFTCRRCGQTFPRLVDVRMHGIADHGDASGWDTLRAKRAGQAAAPRGRRTRVRIEDIAPSDPPDDDAGPRVSGGAGRVPFVEQAASPSGPTRESIALALTDSDLADIFVMLSKALADADGAGEAGVLLRSEAALIAKLVHESTVDLIVRRFEGNVERAKLALAVVVLLFARGRIHAQAIYRRMAAERAARAYTAQAAAAEAAGRDAESVSRETPGSETNGTYQPGPLSPSAMEQIRRATVDIGAVAPAES